MFVMCLMFLMCLTDGFDVFDESYARYESKGASVPVGGADDALPGLIWSTKAKVSPYL